MWLKTVHRQLFPLELYKPCSQGGDLPASNLTIPLMSATTHNSLIPHSTIRKSWEPWENQYNSIYMVWTNCYVLQVSGRWPSWVLLHWLEVVMSINRFSDFTLQFFPFNWLIIEIVGDNKAHFRSLAISHGKAHAGPNVYISLLVPSSGHTGFCRASGFPQIEWRWDTHSTCGSSKKKLLPRLSSKKKEKNHWVKKVKKSKCNVGGKGSNNNPWGELKPNKGEKEQVKTNTVKELLNTFKSRCSSPHCQKWSLGLNWNSYL